ncbi:MAG TPA: hypothetical protein VGC67_13535 [Cellulomonas sp.]
MTSAWTWPVDALACVVAAAGFTVEELHARTDPGVRPHGAIVARLAGAGDPPVPPSAPGEPEQGYRSAARTV